MDEVLPGPAARPRQRVPAVNVALFLLTVATTIWAGFLFSPLAGGAATLANVVRGGLPFASSLVSILFCHEMGHYVLARRHGVDSTLPYFIPAPFGFGTFGAVIRLRSVMPSRRATLLIGAAGPLAGFAVALPLLLWGVAHSEVRAVGEIAARSSWASPFEAVRSILAGRHGAAPAAPFMTLGDSLLTWLAARWMVGPLPAGHDVVLHPVALAAWIGLLITALNLVPVGQLDGGHVLYALLGRRRAEQGSRIASGALLAAGLFLSWNWLVWWALTRFVVGFRHPPALVEEPLEPWARALGTVTLVLFGLTFVPVPFA
jgi:membrane-associated protease RseP (regulator of RpoE activity)